MLQVGVVGYGTIGKRIADAIRRQPDMSVAGVAKRTPDATASVAAEQGYPLYAIETDPADFRAAGIDVAGTVRQLLRVSEVVVDATPAGVGAENQSLYDAADTPAIYQGGESPDIAPVSFTARANYSAAVGADAIRVVSCNTTGLARLLAPVDQRFGVERAHATLIRRGGDPVQSDRGPINDTVPDPMGVPSHHAPDLKTVLPEVSITTMGLKVPTTLMHVHAVNIRLERSASEAAIREVLADERRIQLISSNRGLTGTAAVKEFAADRGRSRADVPENCLWTESITVDGKQVYCYQAIHQESNVVPENIDAIRALANLADQAESMTRTDDQLGIGKPFTAPQSPAAPRL